jgi:hypothetical protein
MKKFQTITADQKSSTLGYCVLKTWNAKFFAIYSFGDGEVLFLSDLLKTEAGAHRALQQYVAMAEPAAPTLDIPSQDDFETACDEYGADFVHDLESDQLNKILNTTKA